MWSTQPATEIAPAFFENPETGQVTLFYGSNRPGGFGGLATFDVYASVVGEDGYFGPGALVPEFSSAGRDTRIFIRKDGLEAFITSDRAGGQGLIDIWTSTRETLFGPVAADTHRLTQSGQQHLRRRLPVAFTRRDDAVFLLKPCGRHGMWDRETSGTQPESKFAQENTIQPTLASFRNRMLAHLAGASH